MKFIHKDFYPTALQLTKHFVSKSEIRPILMYSYHAENGDLVACDTHTMLLVKDCHGFERDYLINPRTYMVAEGKYVDYINIAKSNEPKMATIELSYDDLLIWRQMHRSMNQLDKGSKEKRGTILMKSEGGKLVFEVIDTGVSFNLPVATCETNKEIELSYKIEQMRNCLNAHSELNNGKNAVTIKIVSPMTPVVIEQLGVTTVLSPLRG